MKNKLLGVSRGSQYSPNHIGNDAAIFELAVEYLRKKGYEVNLCSENEFLEKSIIEEDFIFNMARDKKSIERLQEQEDLGKMVINSAYGITNCTREKMTTLLIDAHIPHPKSVIVDTANPDLAALKTLGDKCWLKRGDFHAIHREDVSFSRNQEVAENILREYSLRGITRAVVNAHLEGDLLKFYGVEGTDFFYWFYPNESSHSKFGLEKINGFSQGIPFDLSYLQQICNKAASTLNIQIYGGDCVVGYDGNMKIIDFNDWPSFAPCRQSAAPYIAECISNKVMEYKHALIL
ncbi:hypothetical protein AwDysgo_00130 [Bacteroidales bacterium]|nr:hypothetical protein AwDysgo_00130 [Bacteroidales bacterium]